MVPKATVISTPTLPPPILAINNNKVNMNDTTPQSKPSRPDNTRASTDPSPSPTPSLLLQGYFKDKDTWARPSTSSSHRNRSPYSRSHLRSRSSGAVAGLPLMTRAHSMPSPQIPPPGSFAEGVEGRTSSASSSSSSAGIARVLPVRARSPFAALSGAEEGRGSTAWAEVPGTGIQSIQEDSELDLRPQGSTHLVQPTALHAARVPSTGRRRPASPLHSLPGASQAPQPPTSAPTASHHSPSDSPSLPPQKEKFNESYPLPHQTLHHHSSASSMTSLSSLNSFTSHPSTPTSARSRSPSISSLNTIEDDPEMEAIEQLKQAMEAEEEGGERRRSLDGPRPSVGFGFARGRSERKRWSVCGGERRGDLDLETIWED